MHRPGSPAGDPGGRPVAGRLPAGHRPTPAAARGRISVLTLGLVIRTRVRISLRAADRLPARIVCRSPARVDRSRPAVTEKFLKMIVNCVALISQKQQDVSYLDSIY